MEWRRLAEGDELKENRARWSDEDEEEIGDIH
jgi:hypothetical protein